MDKTTAKLVDFTQSFPETDMTPAITAKAVDLLFDSAACAVAGSGADPAPIVARVARAVRSDAGATVFGYGFTTSPELAALANTMMVRTYDYNDAFYGHPSDMIPGVLAAGEVAHASGAAVLAAVAIAYEVYGAFAL